MHIDKERDNLEGAISSAEVNLASAEWNLWIYDRRQEIEENHLTPCDLSSTVFAREGHALASDVPADRCKFDNLSLVRVSHFYEGDRGTNLGIYKCRKCGAEYLNPLGESELRELQGRLDKVIVS